MNRLKWLILIAVAAAAGWWLWAQEWNIADAISQYVENGEIVTLEARVLPEAIMEHHRRDLLPDSTYAFQEPALKYYPYLLIEAKYTLSDKKTREGVLLWSLVNGEMVIDADSWQQTHGFEDAINANATRTDFKVINAIAKYPEKCTLEKLQNELHLDEDTIDPWIKSVCQKHLVVQSGNELRLHLENPKLLVIPETKIAQAFVTKPYVHAQRISPKYSRSQIERTAQAAFGPTFTIRTVKEISIPVYIINVSNPDHSTLSSHWNGITGERIR